MLIAKACPIMCVYRKHGGQRGYKGHVLNLPQNIQGFLTKLPANVAQLPFLIIRRHGADNTFKDCTVRREKVLGAITWLKHNNPYYADIEIDQEALQQLPVHGVPEHLPTLDDPDANLEPLLQLDINNSGDQEEPPEHNATGSRTAASRACRCCGVSCSSRLRRLSLLACSLLWRCSSSLVKAGDKIKWDSS